MSFQTKQAANHPTNQPTNQQTDQSFNPAYNSYSVNTLIDKNNNSSSNLTSDFTKNHHFPQFSSSPHPVTVTMSEDFHALSIDSGIYLSNTSTQSVSSIHTSDELEDKINKLNLRVEAHQSIKTERLNRNLEIIEKNQSTGNNQKINQPINEQLIVTKQSFENQPPIRALQSFCLPQNSDGDTILHLAVIQNDIKQVASSIRFLHQHHLDTQNHAHLHTPLHLASVTGSLKIARFLVLLGASTTLHDRSGDTPLHIACNQGNLPMVRKLTLPPCPQELSFITKHFPHFGPSNLPQNPPTITPSNMSASSMAKNAVDLCNYEGKPPLHLAYFSDHPDRYFIIEFLVTSCRADVNVVEGKSGYSLLHEMVKMGDEVGMSLLLNLPIPPSSPPLLINHRCYGNMTPLDMAVCLGRGTIEGVLRSKGCVCSEYHSFKMEG